MGFATMEMLGEWVAVKIGAIGWIVRSFLINTAAAGVALHHPALIANRARATETLKARMLVFLVWNDGKYRRSPECRRQNGGGRIEREGWRSGQAGTGTGDRSCF